MSFDKAPHMRFPFQALQHILGELKRRHVTRVACAYAVAAFVVMQVATTFFPALNLPAWMVTMVAILAIVGFPVAIALAWAFDLTPTGVQRTEGAASSPEEVSSRRLIIATAVVLMLATLGAFAVTRVSTADDAVGAVAVLPFQNWSGVRENEFFSDGITDDVLTQLARIDGLKVISRTSVMQYKGVKKPISQIANELRVGAVLEGSVRRDGNKVRITAQLIDAANDRHLWAATYDRDISDIFAVQSEIATEIAAALRTKLTPTKRAELERVARRSTQPEVYEEYLRGLHFAGISQRDAATEHLLRAITLDPQYAPAYAALARNYYFQTFLAARSPREIFPKVKQAAEQALELDADLADAHATLGLYLLHFEKDFTGAEREFQRALQLAPANAQVHHDYSHYLVAAGRSAESAAASVRAAELDPNNSMLQACAGWHRFADGHYTAAIEGAQKALMMMPNMFWPEVILGWGHQQTGNMNAAITTLRAAVAHSNERSLAQAALAHALAQDGKREEALALLRKLERPAPENYVSPYDVAVVHAGLGQIDEAFKWLNRAYDEHAAFLVFVGWDPRFSRLRKDVRYTELARRIGLPTT